MQVQVRAVTDIGLRRAQNEDSHGIWQPEAADERARRGVLLVVADGMGGARAGEVASRLAVESVLESYGRDPDAPLVALQRAFERANRAVHTESRVHPERGGMGTTLTALVLRERDAFIAHVGDSRVYRVRGGRIEQLTADHSLVAQLVRERQLTPEEARVDPRRNVVTRSVGVGPVVEVDLLRLDGPPAEGDVFLLATDGLHGVMTDDEIAAQAADPDPDRVGARLVALALERGGPDNVTVLVAHVGAAAPHPGAPARG